MADVKALRMPHAADLALPACNTQGAAALNAPCERPCARARAMEEGLAAWR